VENCHCKTVNLKRQMQVPTAAIFTTTAKRLATGNGKNPNRKASKKKKKKKQNRWP